LAKLRFRTRLIANRVERGVANVDINTRNVAINTGKRKTNFDFTHEDAAPDIAFNEDIWKTMKGEKSKMPAPKRSAFVKIPKKAEGYEDDDDD
jgi:hypothetical protein